MSFKRSLSPSTPPGTTSETNRNSDNTCKVCRDQAKFHYYGVLSCSSCTTFFRCNNFDLTNICPCIFNGNCAISILTRSACTACRFAKCFAVGMNSDQIREEDFSESQCKRKQLVVAKSFTSAQLPPLNLLTADQPSLTTSDWTLLSNVVHAFDAFDPVDKARLIIERVNLHSDSELSLDLMTTIYSSVELFISSTPDFRIMTSGEQQSLVDRNIQGLWSFHSCITFRESGVFLNTMNERVISPLYGDANVQQTKRITAQLDYDLILIKLMMITFAFSSNLFTVIEKKYVHGDSLLRGTFRIYGSQNVYLELTWNYMIYRYGFTESVKRFAALVKSLLDMITLSSNITESNTTHRQLANESMKQTKHSLNLGVYDNTSLWGKSDCI